MVGETNGSWGNAGVVPGLSTLNGGSFSQVNSLSCGSVGNCAAGGIYYSNGFHAWVANEKSGSWGKAIEVPGTPALRGNGSGAYTNLTSISCGSAGNCAAGGEYYTGSYRAWVASEKNGVWLKAVQVPGTTALNVAGNAQTNAVSCVTANFCAAGGFYTDASHNTQAFVVSSDVHGVWGKARVVPGTQTGGAANLTSISCGSVGNCTAGGNFTAPDGAQAFVVSSKSGTWGKAKEVPAVAALDNSTDSQVLSISCISSGNCAATGYYDAVPDVFVVREKNGAWGNATTLPGLTNLGYGNGTATPISCAKVGPCAAGGSYYNGSTFQAFVTAP